MGMRELEGKTLLSRLGQASFASYGCKRYGVDVQDATTYEQLIEGAGILSMYGRPLHLEHDGAGAPLLVDDDGVEQVPFISLTDEDGSRGIAWVDPRESADVIGVGVDLATRGSFPFTESRVRWYRRIFTEREMATIHDMCPHDLDLASTLHFSGKEATFKAASQQIRKLFREAGGELEQFGCPYFEIRDIEVVPDVDGANELARLLAGDAAALHEASWHANGFAHIGDAAAAFAFLGIGRFSVRFALIGNMVLSVAVALR